MPGVARSPEPIPNQAEVGGDKVAPVDGPGDPIGKGFVDPAGGDMDMEAGDAELTTGGDDSPGAGELAPGGADPVEGQTSEISVNGICRVTVSGPATMVAR